VLPAGNVCKQHHASGEKSAPGFHVLLLSLGLQLLDGFERLHHILGWCHAADRRGDLAAGVTTNVVRSASTPRRCVDQAATFKGRRPLHQREC
jgi:hypothetical protein